MLKDFEIKEKEYWGKVSDRYNKDYHESIITKSYDKDFVDYVLLHYNEGDRVLDLGCGPSSLWNYWKKSLKNPNILMGVDISEDNIELCRKKHPDDDFRVGSIFNLPVESGSIDLVIISSVLHHIPNESLEEAFKEIYRVMDEHGTIIGREPIGKNRLGDAPGWLSGALMAFRHMVYRITNTREFPEPYVGDHHHAFDVESFLSILEKFFLPNSLTFRFPVSSFVARCNNKLVKQIVDLLDDSINHLGGQQFYYTATKNYCNSESVAYCIIQHLKSNNAMKFNEAEFLALLYKASEIIYAKLNKNEE